MACVGCKGTPAPSPVPVAPTAGQGEVLVLYIGPKVAPIAVRGPSKRTYVVIPGRAVPMLAGDVAKISAVIPLQLVSSVTPAVVESVTAAVVEEKIAVQRSGDDSLQKATDEVVLKEQKEAFLKKVLAEYSEKPVEVVKDDVLDVQTKNELIEAEDLDEGEPSTVRTVKPRTAESMKGKRGRPKKAAE